MTQPKEEAGAIRSPDHDSETPLPPSGVEARPQVESPLVPRFAPGMRVYFYVFIPQQRKMFGTVVSAPGNPCEDYSIRVGDRIHQVCWARIGPA